MDVDGPLDYGNALIFLEMEECFDQIHLCWLDRKFSNSEQVLAIVHKYCISNGNID